MKKLSAIFLNLILILNCFVLGSCSSEKESIFIEEPQRISTGDEVFPSKNNSALEKSDNVNGMRFACTLRSFTQRYNKIMDDSGGNEFLDYTKWEEKGEILNDLNNIQYRNYIYNGNGITFTASVEQETHKLMNVGCGSTTGMYVQQGENKSLGNIILKKTAIMAAAACGYYVENLDVLQDIFYRTTMENMSSLYYKGMVYSLSIKNNNEDKKRSTMLFRVYPISDSRQAEWKYTEYEAVLKDKTDGASKIK